MNKEKVNKQKHAQKFDVRSHVTQELQEIVVWFNIPSCGFNEYDNNTNGDNSNGKYDHNNNDNSNGNTDNKRKNINNSNIHFCNS